MKIARRQLRKLINEMSGENIVSREFYTEKQFGRFRPVSNEGNVHMKPKGLWYSCNESWKEWVTFDMPQWWESYNFKYDIRVNLNSMLVIRTMEELLAFEQKYSAVNSPFGPGFKVIDWGAVANDYAGIEICPYHYDARFSSDWYYGWDVASGCIWDSSALVTVSEVYPFR